MWRKHIIWKTDRWVSLRLDAVHRQQSKRKLSVWFTLSHTTLSSVSVNQKTWFNHSQVISLKPWSVILFCYLHFFQQWQSTAEGLGLKFRDQRCQWWAWISTSSNLSLISVLTLPFLTQKSVSHILKHFLIQSRALFPCRASSPYPLTWLSISGCSSSRCKRLGAGLPGLPIQRQVNLWEISQHFGQSSADKTRPGSCSWPALEMCQPLTAITKC